MKDFGAAGAGIQTMNIASDAASDVVLGGYFYGAIDFGAGPPPGGGTPAPHSFVVRLSADGALLAAGEEYARATFDDLTSDAQGNVAISLITDDGALSAGGSTAAFYGVLRAATSGAQISAATRALWAASTALVRR
jgi:hypothetical protein